MLVGREDELRRLEAFVDAVAGGAPATLLVVGDPGIGKSTLLVRAAELAAERGVRVVSASAVESERDMPGALLDVVIGRLGGAPGGGSVDVLLDALVAASSSSPLLLCLDDVHWADGETRRALTFALRRLYADAVGILLAGRPEVDDVRELAEVERLRVGPLADAAAVQLLLATNAGLAPDSAARVAGSLGAVPLALVEAAALLSADQLHGRAALAAPVPVGRAVAERYAAGFRALPEAARLAVTVLAADDGSGLPPLALALARAGAAPADLVPAEDAGLVVLGGRPAFRHPLARSAVYAEAAPSARRIAHEAWAEAARENGDTVRELRHRASAASGPDEALAADLEREAERLVDAGLRVEASAAAESALAFTADPAGRRRRLTLVAETTLDMRRLRDVVDDVLAAPEEPDLVVRCLLALADATGPGLGSDRLRPALAVLDRSALDADLALRLDSARVWAAVEDTDPAALRALADELVGSATSWLMLATVGIAYTFVGDHGRAVPLLRRAVAESGRVPPDDVPLPDLWTWAIVTGWLGEDVEEHRRRIGHMARRFRATRAPGPTATAAFFAAERARRDGRWPQAEALYVEGRDIGRALGEPTPVEDARLAALAAWRGDAGTAEDLLRSAERDFDSASDARWNRWWVPHTRGVLALTEGRWREAAAHLTPVADSPVVGRGCRDAMALASFDLVEALVAQGETARAADRVERIAERLDGIVDPLGLALLERCRGLVSPDGLDRLREAARLHELTDDPWEAARTWLHLGERLRRDGRPKEAREPLAAAHDVFARVGSGPWAERAARELRASGQAVDPAAAATTAADLTPQELRVALAVADGLTNNEVAAALFLSVKTVEFHLGRVFRKLEVRSRTALRVRMEQLGLL